MQNYYGVQICSPFLLFLKAFTKFLIMKKIIVLISIFFLFAAISVSNAQENKKVKQYNIENCISKFDMSKTVKTSVGYQFWFADKDFIDGRTLKMSVVAPKQATHAPHKHADDEFFFVLEGTAKFYLDGKTTTGGAYTSFYCPPGSEHGISNAADTELKYLVIRKYQE